ncbi:MAG TPA: hypothetical protein VNM48_19010 [Chloroflexota bacterium]|nr:hypothetical protein [Chloroflexota bacterium]
MMNPVAGVLAVTGFALLVYALVLLLLVIVVVAYARPLWHAGTWLQHSYSREDRRAAVCAAQLRPGEVPPLRRTGPL